MYGKYINNSNINNRIILLLLPSIHSISLGAEYDTSAPNVDFSVA